MGRLRSDNEGQTPCNHRVTITVDREASVGKAQERRKTHPQNDDNKEQLKENAEQRGGCEDHGKDPDEGRECTQHHGGADLSQCIR